MSDSDGPRLLLHLLTALTAGGCWLVALAGFILAGLEVHDWEKLTPGLSARGRILAEGRAYLREESTIPKPGVIVKTAGGRFVFDDSSRGRYAQNLRFLLTRERMPTLQEIRIEGSRLVFVSRIPRSLPVGLAAMLGFPVTFAVHATLVGTARDRFLGVMIAVAVAAVAWAFASWHLRQVRRAAAVRAVEVRDAIEAHAGLPPRSEA